MTKAEFVNKLTRTAHKANFQLKKHSPEILVIGGVFGVVVSAVMACKATTKLHAVLDNTKEKIDMYHQGAEDGQVQSVVDGEVKVVDYSKEDCTRDISIAYAKTGLELAKLYGPAIILGGLSITAILTSHNVMRKRNVALAAAYLTEHTGFKEYRQRVVDRFGEQLDRELKYNVKTEEVEKTIVNEDGTETTVKETVETAYIPEDDYSVFFDDGCKGWEKDAEHNKFFLKSVEAWANDVLEKRGYLFLNEVYEQLGCPKTRKGHVIGWVYDKNDPSCNNHVSFNLYDYNDPKKRDFINGRERVVLVDFNVDGNIYDLVF